MVAFLSATGTCSTCGQRLPDWCSSRYASSVTNNDDYSYFPSPKQDFDKPVVPPPWMVGQEPAAPHIKRGRLMTGRRDLQVVMRIRRQSSNGIGCKNYRKEG